MGTRNFLAILLAIIATWIYFQWTIFEARIVGEQNKIKITTNDSNNINSNSAQKFDSTVPETRESINTNEQKQAITTPKIDNTNGQLLNVSTELFNINIDSSGGNVVHLELVNYKKERGGKELVTLVNKSLSTDSNNPTDSNNLYMVIENGLISNSKNLKLPNHASQFTFKQTQYKMQGDKLEVPLYWENEQVKVEKKYIFYRGVHKIDLEYSLFNKTDNTIVARHYSQLARNEFVEQKSAFIATYTGPVLYTEDDKYQKIAFDDIDTKVKYTSKVGWGAFIQHYFLAAVIPKQSQDIELFIKKLSNNTYSVGFVEQQTNIPPSSNKTFTSKLYVGPKLQDDLAPIATGLELTVDYGFLTIIAEPIFIFMQFIHKYIGNWGWTIIILTIIIKILFYKLSESSYRSMAKLRRFQPKMKQLKENYGDDKKLFQRKLMELYKQEKVNPMGGCLPILVQMPFFIALYWVLLESVEFRQAEWILWITDLSIKDPYFILPILMGLSMYTQQKLNPTAMMDEMQARILKFLPLVFTIFFAFFPAGLVLYWVVNNVLSFSQQWYITRKVEKEFA